MLGLHVLESSVASCGVEDRARIEWNYAIKCRKRLKMNI